MKNKHTIFYFFIIIALCAFTVFTTAPWHPKEGTYTIKFSTDKASGVINGLKGTINFDKNDLTHSIFNVTVDVNTLNMGNGLKNRHAKDANFFDAAHYPTIHFVSTKFAASGNNYVVNGNLTIKNITKPVVIPFSFINGGNSATFNGSFQINRKDYALNRNGVGEIVKIDLSIPVTKK